MIGQVILSETKKRLYDRYLTIQQFNESSLQDRFYQNHNGHTFVISESKTEVLQIEQKGFYKFSIDLSFDKFSVLNNILIKRNVNFNMMFLPSGYFKNQRSPLYRLTLDVFNKTNAVKSFELIGFSHSYGTIKVNGIESGITHSGGTYKNSEIEEFKNVTWQDYLNEWTLYGTEGYKAIKSIAENL